MTNSERVLPYVFVADDAFALKRHMLKPYPFQNMSIDRRIFNYRLSRARRIIENTFGILAHRFRIFFRPIFGDVERVVEITQACVALHNFLIREEDANGWYDFQNDEEVPSSPYFQDVDTGMSRNFAKTAKMVREQFNQYFSNEGAVEWQWERVTRTV